MARRALCIGINGYPGTDMGLRGCLNDPQDGAAELARRGFETTLLLNERAHKAALQSAMATVIDNAQPGDTVAITFSGHGTYVFNTDASSDARQRPVLE